MFNKLFPNGISDDVKKNLKIAAWISVVIMPLTAAITGIYFLLYSKVKYRPYFVTTIALSLSALSLIIFNSALVNLTVESYTGIFDAAQAETIKWTDFLLPVVKQLPLAFIIGGIAGSGFALYRHKTDPIWGPDEYRYDSYDAWQKKRRIDHVTNPRKSPVEGAILGMNDKNEIIIQTEQEAAAHTVVTGGSGTGKTETLLRMAHDFIRNGHGYAFIDLKGSPDVPYRLKNFADIYGQDFLHFTISSEEDYRGPADSPAYYDPIGRGDPSRQKDLIIAMRDWSDDYYKKIGESYLQTAFLVYRFNKKQEAAKNGGKANTGNTLGEISAYLNPDKLRSAVTSLDADIPEEAKIIEAASDWVTASANEIKQAASVIQSLRTQLNLFRTSAAGQWLAGPDNPYGDGLIDFQSVAQRGQVVVFSLDAATYPETAASLASLIIQDLLTVSSELRQLPENDKPQYPFHVVIDEFSAIRNSKNIVDVLARVRDSNMSVTIATQSLSDLDKVELSLAGQIFGAINCFMIHRPNTIEDATRFAGLIGTDEHERVSETRHGDDSMSTTSSRVDDFIISPKTLQKLKTGHMVYVAKSPDDRAEVVKVHRVNIPEPEASPATYERQESKTHEENITIEQIEELDQNIDVVPMKNMGGQNINNPYINKFDNVDGAKGDKKDINDISETATKAKPSRPNIFKNDNPSTIRPVKIPRPEDNR